MRGGKMPSRELRRIPEMCSPTSNLPHADDLLGKAELAAKIIAEIQRRDRKSVV